MILFKRKTRILLTLGLLAVIFMITVPMVLCSAIASFMYPAPPLLSKMPPIVDQSADQLLARLEAILKERAPAILDSLNPGLSDEAITKLETDAGLKLTEGLRAPYRWRNGSSDGMSVFISIYRFVPLDEAIRTRDAMRSDVQSQSAVQRAIGEMFVAHRGSWIEVFVDPAGDGYYYDPDRAAQPGSFFYNFNEVGEYRFFPSFRNFLAGAIECFETGIYKPSPTGSEINENYDRSEKLWDRYSIISFGE